VPNSCHPSRAKLRVKFFEYSASREYSLQPDIVKYVENAISKPGFDLILSNTMKELGIVLDFWTKEITLDEISLPMGDINKLRTRATIERAWTMNNIISQSMSKEPQSMRMATKCIIQILDTKYEKTNLRAIVEDD